MRKARVQRSQARKFTTAWKPGILALILSMGFSAPVAAVDKSCNPDLDFTILNQGPYFLGETLRISANIGARDIVGGNFMDISAFGFALNCHLGEDYQNCTSAGHTVSVLGNPSTDCKDSQGNDATLLFPQGNKIPIRTGAFPIRTGAGEQCNVQFDMQVTGLAEGSKKVVQAMGWPFEGEKATLCDNGLTSTASSTIAFNVETCDINVEKQVYDSESGQWMDADSEESAVGIAEAAEYRLVVTNTGTAGYVENITVNDDALGIATTYAFPAGPGPLILTDSEVSGLLDVERCAGQAGNKISNLASVGAVCRGGDNPVTASSSDVAWVDCAPIVYDSSVSIEKATNGEDADEPTGPQVPVGSTVTWEYHVVNTGETTLTGVTVTDSDIGDITCPKDTLAPQEEMFCEATGTAVEGQYGNIGYVVAQGDSGEVMDNDPSHYFGFDPSIELDAAGICVNDAPWVEISTFETTGLGDVDPADVNYRFIATDGSDEVVKSGTLADGPNDVLFYNGTYYVLWPDAEVVAGTPDPNPLEALVGDAWPGWELVGGVWVQSPTNRTPDLDFEISINPTATANVIYPPATPFCVPGPREDIKVEKSVENVMVNQDGSLDVTYRVSVRNDGGYEGVYDLEDTLMVDEALTAVDVVSGVTYVPGTDAGTDGSLNDDLAVGDFSPTAELVADEGLEAGKNEAFEFVVQFEIDGLLTTVEGANCDPDDDGETNTGLTNYVEVLVDGEAVDDAVACDEFELTPEILIVKEIWDGDEWVETAGPVEAPSGALYRLKVTNTGNIALLSVVVTDPMLGNPETVYYEFGPLLVGEEYIIEAGQGADGSWPLLDVAEVCGEDDRGDHTNTATATAVWEVDGDTVSDSDMATLQCIGPPEIAILKEISIDGGPWLDANEEPWATAVFDLPDNPVPAEYRLTVSNASTEGVDLYDVVVNDLDLNIVNYAVGDLLAGGDPVVIDSGDIQALAVSSICGGLGEVDNLAEATGTSAAGESNTASDPATILCVDKPSLSVLKEVSKDGSTWSPTSVSAVTGDDAYYRITVTNDGSVPMINVTVSDDDLSIGPIAIGDLDVGESVTVVHSVPVPDAGLVEEPDLYIPEFCGFVGFTFENTAVAEGASIYGGDSVNAEDSALYTCTVEKVDYCEDNSKPGLIKLQYNGTYDRDSVQDTPEFWENGYYVDPPDATGPIGVSPVTVKLYDKNELEATHTGVTVGDTFDILGKWRPDGGVPPNVKVEILDGNDPIQTIWFHGSCSAPLAIGDELGAVTIIGISAKIPK